jgi:hypothetical protein
MKFSTLMSALRAVPTGPLVGEYAIRGSVKLARYTDVTGATTNTIEISTNSISAAPRPAPPPMVHGRLNFPAGFFTNLH